MPADRADELLTADADGVDRTPFVPFDNTTLVSILDGLATEGYSGHFVASPAGRLHCETCGTGSVASAFDVRAIRRLEGASDVDELVAIVVARCPSCDHAGVAILGYGPGASDYDAAVLTQLNGSPGATPSSPAAFVGDAHVVDAPGEPLTGRDSVRDDGLSDADDDYPHEDPRDVERSRV